MAADPKIVRLLERMLERPGMDQYKLADELETSQSSVSRWLKTVDPKGASRDKIMSLAAELGLIGADKAVLIPIVGKVGADTSGRILYGHGQGTGDMALLPAGADADSVAVEVVGDSMGMRAPDGSLIFYAARRDPPDDDMIGHLVIVGLANGEVLVKRLMRGSRRGVFNLESVFGSLREDEPVEWAAHIQSIVPPVPGKADHPPRVCLNQAICSSSGPCQARDSMCN